jgi:hypothetical protein
MCDLGHYLALARVGRGRLGGGKCARGGGGRAREGRRKERKTHRSRALIACIDAAHQRQERQERDANDAPRHTARGFTARRRQQKELLSLLALAGQGG